MRIGINVPNELLKQVKEIRPAVNISQVCREALEARVETFERAVSRASADGMGGQVARLGEAIGNPLIEPDWETYALEDAREWVEKVTAEDWEWFIEDYDYYLENNHDNMWFRVEWWSSMNGSKGFWHRRRENQEWFFAQFKIKSDSGSSANPFEEAQKEYARAWLGYVLEVRRMLKRHWKEEYDKLVAEREQYRLSLPEPELPRQLIEEE